MSLTGERIRKFLFDPKTKLEIEIFPENEHYYRKLYPKVFSGENDEQFIEAMKNMYKELEN